MIKIALTILFAVGFILPSYAVVRRVCKVQYATSYGWSQEYTMEVTYMTGAELNNATHSYTYDPYKKFCLLWFSNGGVAINQIEDYFLCGPEFDDDAFRNLFFLRSNIRCKQINSTEDEAPIWKITGKTLMGDFVDPRDN
jgi:hypothetical protein